MAILPLFHSKRPGDEKSPQDAQDEVEEVDELPHLVFGYPKLAGRMRQMPETAIFRQFNELNLRILLYLQAELCRLERQLLTQEKADSTGEGLKPKYAKNYKPLSESHQHADSKQLDLVLKIKAKLKGYNEALYQASRLPQSEKPDTFDLRDLQHFLNHKTGGSNCLRGDDCFIWGTVEESDIICPDLIGLRPRIREDAFSHWVAEHAVGIITKWVSCFQKPKKIGEATYYDSTVLKFTFWMNSILASLLPVASIIVLIYLDSVPARIGAIAVFNVLISVCLTIFTDAKRTDVFAVTAAYVYSVWDCGQRACAEY
ncbi:hypothetical protein BDV95DRAFT_627680 [Massariosphaeria phaeospora]|uniref:DUF6594 domain-containing protein n=1 Tax=Massariosphaeria phaeospora TaxID=100035 RepID=A0A7C8MP44_9PLEO|nr:hypothetical protein BDV95DRAFT_627680 [Massariosphaeria phaeospora]